MRISDWISDVCASDLDLPAHRHRPALACPPRTHDPGACALNLDIRTMTAAEVELAVEWAAREGWDPGVDDAACFRAADAGGFLMAFADGEPVASISVVNYGPGFGFLGRSEEHTSELQSLMRISYAV